MSNFWDFEVWGFFSVLAVLLASLLVANVMRKTIKPLKDSLIPTSVLGGAVLVLIAAIYKWITGDVMFDTAFFGGNGTASLELLTYHCLALGFIAATFKPSQSKMTKKRTTEIFNTGVTTVATYLLQAVCGMVIAFIATLVLKDFFVASGILLPFGYGQGTGQALNYGGIYENMGFEGGKSFGLTIAALGFISASLGGVIYLTYLKRANRLPEQSNIREIIRPEDIQGEDEIPMQESIDKFTVQLALIGVAYFLSYLMMYGLGLLLPGMRAVIYGFNFLLGVLAATLIKTTMNGLKKAGAIKREYVNSFLMTRASNFFYDLMVVAGIAAIRFGALKDFWGVILIMGVVGLLVTYGYNMLVAKVLFRDYYQEQFLCMYGMLTGTASTGVILLREIDGNFATPASDNLVYQNFPAMVFGFPLMLLATLAPEKPVLTLIILIAFFLVMNLILFRSFIFRRKKK